MNRGNLVDEYNVEPFTIQIFDGHSIKSFEKEYVPSYGQEKSRNVILFEKIKTETINRLKTTQIIPKILKLEELSVIVDTIIEKIVTDYRIDKNAAIQRVIRYQILGFTKILPLLLDHQIEEIYLDNPQTAIYVDHAHWGRCRTPIFLSTDELSQLITRARIEGNAPLNRANPSLKTDLVTQDFTARISIDIAPIVVNGLHVDIRKLSTNPRTLESLIQNQTLNSMVAAYLVFLLYHRCNIAVIGEPGAGKTTFMNALDLLTPYHWRKITIEDIIESVDQSKLGFHQVRFKVDPLEKDRKSSTKSQEIIKLLHRSPDWVYFGEIQTEEQTQALFHALTTGLKGIFSFHATSPEHLVIRSAAHYKIPSISLHALDVIIHVQKTWIQNKMRRQISRITEIGELPKDRLSIGNPNTTVELIDTFRFHPGHGKLESLTDLFFTPTLERIKKEVYLDEGAFSNKLQMLSTMISSTSTLTPPHKHIPNEPAMLSQQILEIIHSS